MKNNKKDSGFVTPAQKSGSWLPEKSYKRYWDVVKSKVDFHVHPHLLRHTYITELCASGMDIKRIQYLAGHEDPRITLKVYAHVVENKPEDMISAVRGAFPADALGVNLGVKRRLKVVSRMPQATDASNDNEEKTPENRINKGKKSTAPTIAETAPRGGR